MIHLQHLITDLALILVAAGITTLIFKKIRQPLVLGYILTGLLVGPHVSLLPTVSDPESIKIWAEIGVIFLLFSLGLEFSFKKLIKVGGSASITAVVEVVCMLAIGYFTGQALGWSAMDSIFLGGILSVSSTTIIIRAFEELGVKSQKFASLVFGILVVEDLVAIVLLVLLSTVAVSQQFAGAEMLTSVLKLSFFLVLWFLAGIFLIPSFLRSARSLMNDETLLVVSLGLCLLMVVLATAAGFSPALGAFIMGSILAETTQAERIEHLIKSVKDLFGAIFFVSVGMLIEPDMLILYAGPVVLITVITIVGKLVSTSLGALLSGQSLKNSVQAGMSLAQIGEFSFIIATLGLTLKVTSDFLYPIAVAVSAVTTFTTPYLIRYSEPFYTACQRILPQSWTAWLNRYQSGTQVISTVSNWKKMFRSYIFSIVIYSVILFSIILISTTFLSPFIALHIADGIRGILLTGTLTFMAMAPFLWALAIRRPQRKAYQDLWVNNKYSRGPLIALEISRIALAVFFVVLSLYQLASSWLVLLGAVAIAAAAVILFSRKLQSLYSWIESRFLSNLNERETNEEEAATPHLVPWDAHIARFKVAPDSSVVGQTLSELAVREKFGVSVALIDRGNRSITAPGGHERLYPGDVLSLIGTDEQFSTLQPLIESAPEGQAQQSRHTDISLQRILIDSKSSLMGRSIKDSGIREGATAMVVGLERAGQRLLNPEASTIFQEGDTVWIVGDAATVKNIFR